MAPRFGLGGATFALLLLNACGKALEPQAPIATHNESVSPKDAGMDEFGDGHGQRE